MLLWFTLLESVIGSEEHTSVGVLLVVIVVKGVKHDKYELNDIGWWLEWLYVCMMCMKKSWKLYSCYVQADLLMCRKNAFELGNGENLQFWEYNWIGKNSFISSFPRFYRIALNQSASIASLASLDATCFVSSWNLSFCRNLKSSWSFFLWRKWLREFGCLQVWGIKGWVLGGLRFSSFSMFWWIPHIPFKEIWSQNSLCSFES